MQYNCEYRGDYTLKIVALTLSLYRQIKWTLQSFTSNTSFSIEINNLLPIFTCDDPGVPWNCDDNNI